jgi:hypothetical protein
MADEKVLGEVGDGDTGPHGGGEGAGGGPGAAHPKPRTGTTQDPDPLAGPVTTALVSIASAVVAGIGSLAFVVAVGGIVDEARFRGAGLPSEPSVAIEGRNVLLAEGGDVLALAVLAALVIVAVIHWSDGRPQRRSRPSWPWIALLAVLLVLDFFIWDDGQISSFPIVVIAFPALAVIGSMIVARLASEARRSRDEKKPVREGVRLLGVFVVLVALGGLAPAAAGLAHPQVRPGAVLLSNPSEIICGIYVGQTSDQLYLGEVTAAGGGVGNHEDGYDVALPRSRIVRLLIGSSQPLTDALDKLQANIAHTGHESRYVADLDVGAHAYPEVGCARNPPAP